MPMPSEVILRDCVAQLRRRVRLLVTARWVFTALVAASLLCSVLVVLDRLQWISAPPEYVAALLAAGALIGVVLGLMQPVSMMDAARLADRRLGLKERLSSGLDFVQRGADDPMTAAQIEDAVGHARGLRPREVFEFRLPLEAKFFAGSLALLLGLVFLPELAVFQSPKVKAEKTAIKKEGERIEKLAKEYRKREIHKNSEITKRIAANMQALGKEMRRGRVGKKESMLRMSRLTKEMRDAQRQVAMAGMPRSLDQAAQDLKKASEAAERRGANPLSAKMMSDMARALENKDYEGAAQTLQQLAEKLQSGQMKPDEAKAAAEALAKMAEAMKDTPLDTASKQLEEAAKRLAEASKMTSPQMQEAMRQAMNQAGQSCAQAGGT
jgi:hypothetical protein